jgi:DNA-binding NarL/FixJ family response regulator
VSIRVVLGEDSYLAREGVRRVIEEEQDIEVVATCGDLDSLRAAVAEHEPDVVLTDISNASHQYRRGHRARR